MRRAAGRSVVPLAVTAGVIAAVIGLLPAGLPWTTWAALVLLAANGAALARPPQGAAPALLLVAGHGSLAIATYGAGAVLYTALGIAAALAFTTRRRDTLCVTLALQLLAHGYLCSLIHAAVGAPRPYPGEVAVERLTDDLTFAFLDPSATIVLRAGARYRRAVREASYDWPESPQGWRSGRAIGLFGVDGAMDGDIESLSGRWGSTVYVGVEVSRERVAFYIIEY